MIQVSPKSPTFAIGQENVAVDAIRPIGFWLDGEEEISLLGSFQSSNLYLMQPFCLNTGKRIDQNECSTFLMESTYIVMKC